MPLRESLKELVAVDGRSLREIDRCAGIATGALAKVLSGKIASPSVEQLEKIAAALGATAGEVLGGGTMRMIAHDRIHQSLRINPRRTVDPAALRELAASVENQGLLEPLVVRPSAAGKFEIVAGDRRWRAIGNLIDGGGWPADKPVPVIVRDLNDSEAQLAALVENLQREDLNPIDEARAYAALNDPEGKVRMSTHDIARAVGKGQRHVQGRIALLDAAPTVQQALAGGQIGPACARAIARAEPELQATLIAAIEDGALMPSEAAIADAITRHAQAAAPADPAPAATGPDTRAKKPPMPPLLKDTYSPAPPENKAPKAIDLGLPVVNHSQQRREGFPVEITLFDKDNAEYGEYRLVGA